MISLTHVAADFPDWVGVFGVFVLAVLSYAAALFPRLSVWSREALLAVGTFLLFNAAIRILIILHAITSTEGRIAAGVIALTFASLLAIIIIAGRKSVSKNVS